MRCPSVPSVRPPGSRVAGASVIPRATDQSGLLLIEVLVGLVIFMVGAFGMVQFIARSGIDGLEARQRTVAVSMAQEYFARLESKLTSSERGASASAMTAALQAHANQEFESWRSNVLQASGSDLTSGNATLAIESGGPTPYVALTITWKVRADLPQRRFVTRRSLI